jgi:hypothetical protein
VKDEALQKCILIGFSDRVARRLDQGTLRCELVHNRRGVLARESVVQHSPLARGRGNPRDGTTRQGSEHHSFARHGD